MTGKPLPARLTVAREIERGGGGHDRTGNRHEAGRRERPPVDPRLVAFPVVALVASAGGVSALARVVSMLPADLPAAVLILLHQRPESPSRLATVLSRHSRMPVDVIGVDTLMRPGRVLVIPPGRHLLVTAGTRVGLIAAGSLPPRPSADLLLATLAVTCGSRALAVILTGVGSDGQAGVRAVAHCGGTVLAQDEITSAFHAMPANAIATHAVQQVLPLDGIAATIIRHVRDPRHH
jgi:two-component system chemotaxis response regulator CheB